MGSTDSGHSADTRVVTPALLCSGILALAAEAAHWIGLAAFWPALLALAAIAAGGLGTYRAGWVAVRNGVLNINALMSIAVTGALAIGQWPEAAMVMFLFVLAERIEARSLDRARHAIDALLRLAPDTVRIRQSDGSWREIPAAQAGIGDVARVRPGERIALDGVIVDGASVVDEAPITGESLPRDKSVGDPVFAGCMNGGGVFEYRVGAVAADTALARIVRAVETARTSRAPIERAVDRFARVYTPAVLAFAVAVALVPPLWTQFVAGGEAAWLEWIYKALVLLVIACPCALVISTPVTVVAGLTAAARHGILVKGGAYLEAGRRLAWIAFDKTGTLTRGKPRQTDCVVFAAGEDVAAFRARAVRLAASLAACSGHPVSHAVAAAAEESGIGAGGHLSHFSHLPHLSVSSFAELPGRGVEGDIEGVRYTLGNHRLIEERKVCSPELETLLEKFEREGKTALMLSDGTRVLALFAVADTLREESRSAVARLHELGVGTLVLSGDNARTVAAIAAEAGIDEAHGEQLPEGKAAMIAARKLACAKEKKAVGMVGDGINDAPALAAADIGFALGAAGSDTAIESADVALLDDDLGKIATFVRLARRTHRLVAQNIALALGIKAVFLALTFAGLGSMWMAVFADMGVSLLVIGNGLRLLHSPRTAA